MTSRKRPRDGIVADVADQLRPWKKGKPEIEINLAIGLHIDLVRRLAGDIQKVTSAASIRKKASDASRALLALERALPGGRIDDTDYVQVRKRTELLTKVEGPAPQFDALGWLCAHQAIVIVNELSAKKPVTSQAGNVHLIAQLISEAVTGDALSGSELLRAVKDVTKWRKLDHAS